MFNARSAQRISTITSLSCLFLSACATDEVQPGEDSNNTKNNVRPSLDLSIADMGDKLDMPAVDMKQEPDAAQDMQQPPQDMGQDQGPGEDMNTMEDMATEDMTPAPVTCAQRLKLDTSFTLDTSGVIPQYYTRTAFDGDQVWVVYARPESATVRTSNVYATKLRCDGSVSIPSFKVNTDTGTQNREPNIAIGDSSIFISYGKEVNGAQRVYMRVLDREGNPRGNTEHDITPLAVDGVSPISNTVWESDLAALPMDQAVLTASYGSSEAAAFQVVAQRVNASGQRLEDPIFPKKEKSVDQTRPSITALLDGTIYISWSRYKAAQNGMPEETQRVVYAKFEPKATTADTSGPFPAQPASTAKNEISRYSKERLASDEVYLAFQTDQNNNILLKDGAFGAPLSFGEAGQSGRLDLRPHVTAKLGGGALAWLRADPSPTKSLLFAQAFNKSAGQVSMGSAKQIPTNQPVRAAGNYGVSISHISGTSYFISWSEGSTSSDATLKGRFVDLR